MSEPRKTSILSVIKWVAIALTVSVLAAFAWKAYRVATTPVRAVQDMGDKAADAGRAMTESAARVYNRLDIPLQDTRKFAKASEAAFAVLSDMGPTQPISMSDRLSRSVDFRGSQNKVCAFQTDFGNGYVQVRIAADHEAYATAKALGSKEDRLMRIMVDTGDKLVAVRAWWDDETGTWQLRWRRITTTKPISDKAAEATALKVLSAVPEACAGSNQASQPKQDG